MKRLFVVTLLVLFCLAAVNIQEPVAITASTSTPPPTSTPTPTPAWTPSPPERCHVDLTDVTLETLTVQVWTNSPSGLGYYQIGINFSDPPCDPWHDAKGWRLDDVTGVLDGEYSTSWLDHFEEGPIYGQEACISWACSSPTYPSLWTGEDSEMLYAHNYLPIIQED